MTKLLRPHIPLSVRVQVAERQVRELGSIFWPIYRSAVQTLSLRARLDHLIHHLIAVGMTDPQLDHDPALILRKFRASTGKYTPDANDPDYLIYRSKADHLQKTTGRKPGALKTITTKGSDIGLKTKFARLERKDKRPKQKIPSRPFQKRQGSLTTFR